MNEAPAGIAAAFSTLPHSPEKQIQLLEEYIRSIPHFPRILGEYIDPTNRHTLLHRAAQVGNVVVIQALINVGADETLRDTNGNTPQALLNNTSAIAGRILWKSSTTEYPDNKEPHTICLSSQSSGSSAAPIEPTTRKSLELAQLNLYQSNEITLIANAFDSNSIKFTQTIVEQKILQWRSDVDTYLQEQFSQGIV